MTGATVEAPEPAGDWPAARHRSLLDGLTRYLDPAAGLRDIMLDAGHAGLTDALTGHLDTKVGLAAVLSPPPAAPRKSPGQAETAAAIASADPAARIALRHRPLINAVLISDLIVRALTIASKIGGLAGVRDLDLGLARDPAAARDLDLARDLARDLSRALGHAEELARELDPRLELKLYSAHRRALDIASHLTATLVDTLSLDDAHADLLDHARGLTAGFILDLTKADTLSSFHDQARDLARMTALRVGSALGLREVEGLAAALRAGALDDFTHADLARADLTGRDLTGIRWSEQGTTWPPGTDTDKLRARSQEIAPGIYEIMPPGHGGKGRHHAPA